MFLSTHLFSKAQTFECDWIAEGQKFIKISVEKEGVYQLNAVDLVTFFPNIYNEKVANFQLFHLGKSIAFEIISTSDIFGKDGKLSFYGTKNDGKYDKILYRPITAQPHDLNSLFSNESAYYLTINKKQLSYNKIEIVKNLENSNNITIQNYVAVKNYDSEFTYNSLTGPIPYIQNSFYEEGEGYTGKLMKPNKPYSYDFDLIDLVDKSINFEILFNGRDNIAQKKVFIKSENKEYYTNVIQFASELYKFSVELPKVSDSTNLTFSTNLGSYSISYIKYVYNKKISFRGSSGQFNFSKKQVGYISPFNYSDSLNFRIWNITDPINICESFKNGNNYDIDLKEPNATLYYFSTYNRPKEISLFTPNSYDQKSNFIIITSKKFQKSVLEYANFRSSSLGGNFSVEKIFIEDLYDSFSYGIKSPLAIKNFIRFKLKNSTPNHLLLIGKAFSSYNGKEDSTNIVPSIGYPASDVLLTSGIITHEDVPGISTGRIPALNDEEVFSYLNKLKQFLLQEKTISNKSIIHLSGGKTFTEIENFGSYMDTLKSIADESSFGLNVFSKRKSSLLPIEPANIVERVNQGVSLISFFGHSSYQLIDLNIDFVSNPLLGYSNNQYPILFFNGCAFNNYFREIPTLSHDWVLNSSKGAIGSIAQSYFGYPSAIVKYSKKFYDILLNSNIEPTIGELLKLTSENIVSMPNYDLYDILNNNQTLLFGDPAIKIFGYNKPDLKLETASFNEATNKLFIKVSNLGKYKSGNSLPVRIILKNSVFNDTLKITTTIPKLSDSLNIPIQSTSLYDEIDMTLDYNNLIDEENENNNNFQIKLYEPAVFKDDKEPNILVLLEQQNPYDKMLVPTSPTFQINIIDDKTLSNKNKPSKNFTIYLKSCDSCQYAILPIDTYEYYLKSVSKTNLELQITLKDLKPGFYEMAIVSKDSIGNSNREKPYLLNFTVSSILNNFEKTDAEVKVYPNPSTNCVTFEWPQGSTFYTNTSINYLIYSLEGKLIYQSKSENKGANHSNIWCADKPGRYTYKIINILADKIKVIASGKIQITE